MYAPFTPEWLLCNQPINFKEAEHHNQGIQNTPLTSEGASCAIGVGGRLPAKSLSFVSQFCKDVVILSQFCKEFVIRFTVLQRFCHSFTVLQRFCNSFTLKIMIKVFRIICKV